MLELLDIEKYIKDNKVQRVSNPLSFKNDDPTPDGLYSPKIFGSTKKEKSVQIGYIDLQTKILHPLVYNNLKKINTIFNKIFSFKMTIKDKSLELVDKDQNKDKSSKTLNEGMNVSWLYENWNKINFEQYKNGKNDQFIDTIIDKGRDQIFITKIIVIPQAFREYVEEHGRLMEDEVSGIYKKLLLLTQSTDFKESDYMKFLEKQANSSKANVIQKQVTNLHNLFIAKLGGGKYINSDNGTSEIKGKKAIMRSKVMGKRINNVSRLVANARPDIPFNCVALPWYVLIYLFDMYLIRYLLKNQDKAIKLGIEKASLEEVGKHIDYIYRNIESYMQNESNKLDVWYEVLTDIFEEYDELCVMTKRDPSWDKNSWISLKPIIMKGMNYHLVINSILYVPLGGDSFSTNIFGSQKDTNVLYQDGNIKITTNNSTIIEAKSTKKLFERE